MLMYLMYATPAARRVCSIISVITIRIIRGAAQAMTLYAILMLDRPFLDDGSLDPCGHATDDPAWLRARVVWFSCDSLRDVLDIVAEWTAAFQNFEFDVTEIYDL
jgi:hypothetical protein